MRDLDKALLEIDSIRSQLAAGTMFRGLGPLVIAMTGLFGLLVAALQSTWPQIFASDITLYLICWIATAVLSTFLIGVEMLARSKHLHGGMATIMILKAIEHFLPSTIAGAAISAVMFKYAPGELWILPGLWQMMVAVGLFAAVGILPRAIKLVAAWYFVAGTCVLIMAAQATTLSPWLMGIPFTVGQLALAFILFKADKELDNETI